MKNKTEAERIATKKNRIKYIFICCGTWNRTKIFAFRERRPTFRRSRNNVNLTHFFRN